MEGICRKDYFSQLRILYKYWTRTRVIPVQMDINRLEFKKIMITMHKMTTTKIVIVIRTKNTKTLAFIRLGQIVEREALLPDPQHTQCEI